MLRSSLCDYADEYILAKENITVNNTAAEVAAAANINKKIIFKTCVPFTNYASKINHTKIDNAQYIDKVMPMCNLIEYSDSYSKNLEAYGNIVKKYKLEIMLEILLILLLIILLIHLNLKQK